MLSDIRITPPISLTGCELAKNSKAPLRTLSQISGSAWIRYTPKDIGANVSIILIIDFALNDSFEKYTTKHTADINIVGDV